MRLRLPELLRARGLTAYALAARSGGRISESTAYRLIEMEGRLQTFGADILAALCDVLEVEPGELFERIPPEPVSPRRGPRPAPTARSRRAR
jgi:DNA-binding Xre family transcriptional regulator